MLQAAADASLDDWFQYTIGPPVMDLTAATIWRRTLFRRNAHGGPSPSFIWMPGLAMS